MIEITDRWGLSKRGKWSLEDEEHETPNIFFLEGGSFEPPPKAEMKLSLDSDEFFSISDFFEPSSEDKVIPSTFGYPEAVGGASVESRGGNDKIQVIYDQKPDPEAELYVIGNAPELLQRSRKLYEKIIDLRESIAPHKLIYAPGIAQPNNLALLVYLGVDLFDSVYCEYLGEEGVELSDWMGFPGDSDKNGEKLLEELSLVRKAVRKGRIRELVESRVRSEPWMVEVLRKADEDYHTFVKGVPVTGDEFFATTRESLNRPDIERYRKRLKSRYEPPERDVLLLLPCSAKKPYFQSRTHRRLRDATQQGDWTSVQELMITSPIGAVPREIEQFYPAQQYDIPVSHQWYSEEKEMIMECLQTVLEKSEYDEVISHLPSDLSFVKESIDCVNTTQGDHPTSSKAIERLAEAVKEHSGEERGDVQRYLQQNLESFAKFQFGPEGKVLLEDAEVKGRYPWYKIMEDDTQRGMIVPERGLISLTLDGAELLKEEGIYLAEIDDFRPKGSVFAVGVRNADKKIRLEDEVIVVHDGELRGVGPASMSGEEMEEAEKGEAVRLRHYP